MSASELKYPTQYSTLTNNTLCKDITIFVGLVVPAVLSVAKLRSAHEELVKAWPVLGGTLVTRTNPYSFTTGDKIDFISRTLPGTLSSTLMSLQFPPFSYTRSTAPAGSNFIFHRRPYTSDTTASEKVFHFSSFLPYNRPPKTLFALRVTILSDGTLLGFRVPHHLVDGTSMFEVISAFSQVLNTGPGTVGRLVAPPDAVSSTRETSPVATRLSTLVAGADEAREKGTGIGKEGRGCDEYVDASENFSQGLWSLVWYILCLLVIQKFLPVFGIVDRCEDTWVAVPGTFVEEWRRKAQEEINEQRKAPEDGKGKDGTGENITLTKNDVLTAWWIKATQAYSTAPNMPVDLMYNMNYRTALDLEFLTRGSDNSSRKETSSHSKPKGVYLHNSTYNIRAHLPPRSNSADTSLAATAARIRRCVIANKQSTAVKRTLEFMERTTNSALSPATTKGGREAMPFLSSWTTMPYVGLDFSGGLPSEGSEMNRAERKGLEGEEDLGSSVVCGTARDAKVVFIVPRLALPAGIEARPQGFIIKDGRGGYWIRSWLSKEGLRGLKEACEHEEHKGDMMKVGNDL